MGMKRNFGLRVLFYKHYEIIHTDYIVNSLKKNAHNFDISSEL